MKLYWWLLILAGVAITSAWIASSLKEKECPCEKKPENKTEVTNTAAPGAH